MNYILLEVILLLVSKVNLLDFIGRLK